MATNKIFILSSSVLVKNEIAKILVDPHEVEIYQATDCYSAQEAFTHGNKRTRDYQFVIFDSSLNPVSIEMVRGLFVLEPTNGSQEQRFHWLNFNVKSNSLEEINLKAQIFKLFREVFPNLAVKEDPTKIDVKKETPPLPTMRILVIPPSLKDSAAGDKNKVKESATSLTLPNSPNLTLF